MRSMDRVDGEGTRGRRDECPSADRRGAGVREGYTQGVKGACTKRRTWKEEEEGNDEDDNDDDEEEEEEDALVQCLSRRNRKSSECVRRERRQGGGASERVATLPSPDDHPRIGGGCIAEEPGGGTAARQSSLRAFQYMARPLRLRGLDGVAGTKRGAHLRGATEGRWAGGVRGAIDSSFNLVATHPSCRGT